MSASSFSRVRSWGSCFAPMEGGEAGATANCSNAAKAFRWTWNAIPIIDEETA